LVKESTASASETDGERRITVPTAAHYLGGWIDSSVHLFLSHSREHISRFRYALITCLDSHTDIGDIIDKSRHLKTLAGVAEIVNKSLRVTTAQLLEANHKERIFFGFDEVWFSHTKSFTLKPRSAWLTGPNETHHHLPGELIRWMNDSQCMLGIGDGTGLNYVVKISGVAERCILGEHNRRMEAIA